MSDPITIILSPKSQILRLSCGQCGDTTDIFLSIEPDEVKPVKDDRKIRVEIMPANDTDAEALMEGGEFLVKAVNITT